MVHRMEREGRDSKGLRNRKVPDPFGALVATRTAVAGATIPVALCKANIKLFDHFGTFVADATIPVALYKANFFQLEHRLLTILSVSHFLRHIPHTT